MFGLSYQLQIFPLAYLQLQNLIAYYYTFSERQLGELLAFREIHDLFVKQSSFDQRLSEQRAVSKVFLLLFSPFW